MTEDPKPSGGSRPEQPRTALYASKENPVVLRPHVYDGIQEYDQKLPNWWLFTFYIMIVAFVLFWVAYYQFDLFKSDPDRINSEMAAIAGKKDAELRKLLGKLDDKSLVAEWSRNEVAVANGRAAFTIHCQACHGADLSALTKIPGMDPIPMPGLPLTDGVWKFGDRPMDIFKLVKDGSPPESDGHNGAKMEAWGLKLSPKSIAELVSFIISNNQEEFAKFAE